MKVCLVFVTVLVCLAIEVSCVNEICEVDADCNGVNNERCQKFDACTLGYCKCKDGYTWPAQSGGINSDYDNVCMRVLQVGATCNNQTTTGACGSMVICSTTASCTCVDNTYSATTDNYSCKRNNRKGSGSACTNNNDCSGGNGITCDASVCKCGEGSTWDSNRKVCMHKFSQISLGEGERCTKTYNELMEYDDTYDSEPQQICQDGMVCEICPEEAYKAYKRKTCMKSAFSAASSVQINAAIFLVSLVATLRSL